MILTKKEAEERLKHENNLFSENSKFVIIRNGKPGPKPDTVHLDRNGQEVIGTLARVMPHQAVADMFGVSKPNVDCLANARPSGYGDDNEQNKDLLNAINKKLAGVADTAVEKLVMALGLISEEKLHNSKARELSGVAKDMATIADKARPVVSDEDKKPKIIFYAPRFHKEEHYETVEIKG